MSDDQVEVEAEPLQHPKGRGLRKGVTTNPSGVTITERQAKRRISEVLRELHTPEEFGNAMWSILEGVDPFAAKRRKVRPVDGLPVLSEPEEPIKWEHRVAAGKLYAEYAWGKPLQGVVVEGHMEQRIQIEGAVQTGPIDFRTMPPEVRAALRAAAAVALGRPVPPLALPAGSVRVVDDRQVDRDAGQLHAPGALARPVDVHAEQVGREPAPELGARGVIGRNASEADSPVLVGDRPVRDVAVNLDEAHRSDVDGLPLATEHHDVVVVAPLNVPEHATRAEVVGVEVVSVHGLTVPALAAPVKLIRLDFRSSANLVDAELEVGDSPDTSTLTVRFRAPGGSAGQVARTYRYRGVTPAMMEAWRVAPSAGAWFAREIRAQHQRYPVIKDAAPTGMVTL